MNFDRIAPHYQWLEVLFAGRTLQSCRTAWLDDEVISGCRSVLIIGEGDGRFLAECATRLPEAEILCVDGSAGMLEAARQRLASVPSRENQTPDSNAAATDSIPPPDSASASICALPAADSSADPRRITFHQAILPGWEPPAGQFDLIVTHFFLDCLTPEDLRTVVHALARAAKPGAHWLLADFHVPHQPFAARLRAKAIIATAYTFFRAVAGLKVRQLADPFPVLGACGFQRERMRSWSWGMLYSSLWRRYPLR